MELINIKNGNEVQQVYYEFDNESGVFTFDKDIQIGEWTVKKNIKIACPKDNLKPIGNGRYLYKNNGLSLEFVLIDPNRKMEVFNSLPEPKKMSVIKYWWSYDEIVASLVTFLSDNPLFSASSMEDYNNEVLLKEIVKVADKDSITATERINRIARLIQK